MSIEDRLRILISKLFPYVQFSVIEDGDDLLKLFGPDALEILDLIIGIEDEFGIKLDDEDICIQKLRTLRSIANVIRPKCG